MKKWLADIVAFVSAVAVIGLILIAVVGYNHVKFGMTVFLAPVEDDD